MKRFGLIGIATLALSLDLTTQAQTNPLTIRPITFTPREGSPVEAEEGFLRVPEDWDRPNGPSIELRFIRFRSTSQTPAAPIVYLAGGPGGSGVAAASGTRFPLFMALREVADVIALDQRGTGGSRPSLVCPNPVNTPLDRPGNPAELLEDMRTWSRQCIDHFTQQGVNLAAYHTNASTDDLEALRKALGTQRISLWGISYGTHLGLAMLRRYPGSIERAVLAGIEGPDHSLKLPSNIDEMITRLGQQVRADANASKLMPDFVGTLKTALDGLERQPVVVEVTNPRTNQPTKVTIGKFDAQLLFWNALSSRANWRVLPAVLAGATKGDYRSLALNVLQYRTNRSLPAVLFSMDCASGASSERLSRIRAETALGLLGNIANWPFPEICALWPHRDLGPEFRSPLRSSVPTLFISGTFDARTPPSNAEEVRAGFSNAAHLVIEGAGHDDELFLSSPEIGKAILAFLKGQPTPSSISLPALDFVIPR